MLLGDDPQRRPKDHQEHADTGSSIWDGAVALAKAWDDGVYTGAWEAVGTRQSHGDFMMMGRT